MGEDVYVVGHKSADTDSVCSAIAYAKIRGYIPVTQGPINEETAFVLNKFGVSVPRELGSAVGKKVVLVDHNEASQAPDNLDKAEIIEIIDHHKMNFSYHSPIPILVEPVGSTATILAKKYKDVVAKDKAMAGLLLGALLSDTVVFKSPTTTQEDKDVAAELAKIAGIDDIPKFGIDVKKAKANIADKPIKDVIFADFKNFDFAGKKVGIGQTEVVDLTDVYNRASEVVKFLNNLKAKEGYEMVIFIATDIIKEGSELYFAGDKAKIEKAFNTKAGDASVYIPGLMSRKKQVVPVVQKVF
ncbi:MAG: manganese-dependent inorganic pyrophosphatase [Nitrospirae bacterium CG11_big_fil_rev_8_21_14_0_20_41_14]|nr:MAG: manganese-dependent inorganic pyrophosphatase [Nitrospirae bacterium CG11_big_fil_rev_8_21_14_0_20_41_14]